MRSAYLGSVKFLRALTLICFSFGLFAQVAAQAAVPEAAPAEMAGCAEMAQVMSEQMDAAMGSSDREGPCPDMTLECFVAMNCVPPLTLSASDTTNAAPLPFAPLYLSANVVRLESGPLLPESPPPQSNLTV